MLTVHDRQTDEVHVEITRKGLTHTCPNYILLSTHVQPPLTVLQPQQGSVIHRALPRSNTNPSASTPPPLLISSIAGMPSGVTMVTTTPTNHTAAATAAVMQAPAAGLPFLVSCSVG